MIQVDVMAVLVSRRMVSPFCIPVSQNQPWMIVFAADNAGWRACGAWSSVG
jgi:hypothetical protein